MTYADLLARLQKMTPEQLKEDATVANCELAHDNIFTKHLIQGIADMNDGTIVMYSTTTT